jgi:hypothetical protein
LDGRDSNVTLGTPISFDTTVQIWSKSFRNDGHFTLPAETVFPPYFNYHFIGANETSFAAFPAHTPQPLQVCSISVSKEGLFTIVAELVLRPYLDYHCIGATETSYFALLPMLYSQYNFGRNR